MRPAKVKGIHPGSPSSAGDRQGCHHGQGFGALVVIMFRGCTCEEEALQEKIMLVLLIRLYGP